MNYRVVLTATARKERKRLDIGTRERIDAALKNLIETARPPGVTKLTGSTNDWRVRVGNFISCMK